MFFKYDGFILNIVVISNMDTHIGVCDIKEILNIKHDFSKSHFQQSEVQLRGTWSALTCTYKCIMFWYFKHKILNTDIFNGF